jgi:hypothetical protein
MQKDLIIGDLVVQDVGENGIDIYTTEGKEVCFFTNAGADELRKWLDARGILPSPPPKVEKEPEKPLISDEGCWHLIHILNWGLDYNFKRCKLELKLALTPKEFNFLKDWVVAKRIALQKHLKTFAEGQGSGFTWGVGDDGFWDLTAHIVGLGKEVYLATLKHPILAKTRADEHAYIENFEYSFGSF